MRGWKRSLEVGVEDLEDDVRTSETGSHGLEGIIEVLEVGTEELEAEELVAMTEDLKVGIEDSGKLED